MKLLFTTLFLGLTLSFVSCGGGGGSKGNSPATDNKTEQKPGDTTPDNGNTDKDDPKDPPKDPPKAPEYAPESITGRKLLLQNVNGSIVSLGSNTASFFAGSIPWRGSYTYKKTSPNTADFTMSYSSSETFTRGTTKFLNGQITFNNKYEGVLRCTYSHFMESRLYLIGGSYTNWRTDVNVNETRNVGVTLN